LLAAIGNNDITTAAVIHYLKAETIPTDEKILKQVSEVDILKRRTFKKSSQSGLVVEGVGNLLSSIAKCCSPIPGDPIIAYITKGRGVTIHHCDCTNIKQAKTYRAERLLEVNWGKQIADAYPVNLSMDAENRTGLIRDITALVANEKISILGLHSSLDPIKDHAHISLTVEIKSLAFLDKLLNQLRNIPAVIAVKRI